MRNIPLKKKGVKNLKLSFLIIIFVFGSSTIYSGCGKEKDEVDLPDNIETPSGNQEDTTGDQDTGAIDTPSYVLKLQGANWDSTWISNAVLWKYYHFTNLFSAQESITVFEVNLNNSHLSVAFPYVTTGHFLKTSTGASNIGAVAAVNGGFFDTKEGGSTVFFKNRGEVISYKSPIVASYGGSVGVSVAADGKVSIIKRPVSGWASTSTYSLLTSGPLLVYDGEIPGMPDSPFNNERNPRTAIGLTDDNRLIAVVVDGRAKQSAGMTTLELARVMKALDCRSAMNLDGGGSSTAWVKGEGIVNYPSDNHKFDHKGERAVATVIAFVAD